VTKLFYDVVQADENCRLVRVLLLKGDQAVLWCGASGRKLSASYCFTKSEELKLLSKYWCLI